MRPTNDKRATVIAPAKVARSANYSGQRSCLRFNTHTSGQSKNPLTPGTLLPLLMIALVWLGSDALPSRVYASDTRDTSPTPTAVIRPILTPSTQFGGMQVIYAGAGDGSWPDQMEPNDGAYDLLGPAPVEVGTLYRSLNLLPRSQPAPNPTPSEDRDWYVWNVSKGRCYRAFTGDIAGSAEQIAGKWKVQHAIRLWWYPPVREGHKLLAEYNPGMGSSEGGYFASVRSCIGLDGQMAAEIYNYRYALKNPVGATYTFAVLDLGIPDDAASAPAQPAPSGSGANYSPGSTSAPSPPLRPVPLPDVQQHATVRPAQPSSLPSPTSTLVTLPTLAPLPAAPSTTAPSTTAPLLPTPSPSPSPKPGSPGLPASVDVVAYLDRNQNGAPDPGEGLHDLRVALLSVRTNSIQEIVSTNADGHARLEWLWAGRARVSLPDLNWSDLVDPFDMASASRTRSGVWSTADDGGLYLEVRVLPAALPAVIP